MTRNGYSMFEKISIALFLLLTACETQLSGQVKLSQRGAVSQTIANTEITIVYNRPSARGRQLFGPGGVVPYGREWCPGADQATRIELSRDILINGQRLPAGEYSIWAIPNPEEWVIIFSYAADVFHVPYPGQHLDALRFSVSPESGAHIETMTYYFPAVDGYDATLRLHWGETIIALEIHTS